jgi:hypothetical protein
MGRIMEIMLMLLKNSVPITLNRVMISRQRTLFSVGKIDSKKSPNIVDK